VYDGEARKRFSRTYAMEVERRKSLEEALEEWGRQATPLVALLLTLNQLRLLYLVPEFRLFLERFWEIIRLPPEVIMQLYPALYYGSLVASSTLPLLHFLLQALAARQAGAPVWVPKGALGAANAALLIASIISLSLFAALSKDAFSLLMAALYVALGAAGSSPAAREVLERAYGGARGGEG